MDNSAAPGMQLPWAGKKVSPEQVEVELSTLWRLASDNMRISQNMNVRTSVLNFVICAQDEKTARQASAVLRDLASTHIARVTLLILDTRSDGPSEVSTWITLRSFPIISDIMRHHFEQVTATVSGKAVQYVDNIVQSLLKPDLPVYLWWLNDLPTDHDIFHRLISLSSRVIIDSSHFTQPEAQISAASAILQQAPQCALSDLTWGRVTAWRELIAQFFDIPEYRPYLMALDTISIEHAISTSSQALDHHSSQMNPIRALLLAAWLKTRLGWKLSEDENDNYRDTGAGTYSWHMSDRDMSKVVTQPLMVTSDGKNTSIPLGGITISIQTREPVKSAPGTLCLVRMVGTVEGKEAIFTIERGDDDEHVITTAEVPGIPRPPRTVSIAATHKESDLLHNELEIMGRDHLYEQTLHEVFALLAQ
ncbi:glucose-6-phosphate dehydrogenase assembly protein OpcA [Dictyobacter alpinus]|nr:glucose-6-phosphate dehydrogenase assembly protein OpcA [Dictyobacter alpinus]